jgi:hypothetical protein
MVRSQRKKVELSLALDHNDNLPYGRGEFWHLVYRNIVAQSSLFSSNINSQYALWDGCGLILGMKRGVCLSFRLVQEFALG